jgi:hypothetical protein
MTSDFQRALNRARRRELASRALHRAAIGLTAGLAAGCLLLAADRLVGLDLPWPWYAILGGVGLVGGLLSVLADRPEPAEVALQLDHAFALKDRFSTAEALATQRVRDHDDAFGALVQRDVERLAGRLDVRSATPIRLSGLWGGASALAAILVLGVLFLPSADVLGREQRRVENQQRAEDRREQQREIAETIEQAVAEVPDEVANDETAGDDVEALKDLASQLGSDDAELDPQQVRDESAARLAMPPLRKSSPAASAVCGSPSRPCPRRSSRRRSSAASSVPPVTNSTSSCARRAR